MIRSVRLRIGLAVLGATLGLVVIQDALVLRRFEAAGRSEVDAFLAAELREVQLLLGTPQLQAILESERAKPGKRDQIFYEIREPNGKIVSRSPNVPPEGLGPFRAVSGRMIFWERKHPEGKAGHRRIRVAELLTQDHRFRVAQALGRQQDRVWDLRRGLLVALAIIAAAAGGVAWLVATRALSPVRRMIDRARALETEPSGLLPRTGKKDELDQLAAVLNQLLTGLRTQMERMRRLGADASHALRTPLTTVRGNLELLAAQYPDSEPIADSLQQVERLHRMVDGLLTLERLDAGSVSRESVPVELGALVEELATDFRLLAEERGIAIHVEAVPALVRGRERELREAIANLVDNALRHTPDGGRVDIAVASGQGLARVEVRDSGRGFGEADGERLFERFYSGRSGGSGIGLGLPISRAIARAHGGEVAAANSGAGAIFTLELPLGDP